MSALDRPWRKSLGARIIGLFLALLLAVQLVSFASLRISLSRHAHSELPARLVEGEQLLQTLLDRRVHAVSDVAEVTAADFGFRTTLFEGDENTIVSALDNLRRRVGATEVGYLGLDGAVLHRASSGNAADIATVAAHLKSQNPSSGSASEIMLVGGQPYQAVLVPVKAPRQASNSR